MTAREQTIQDFTQQAQNEIQDSLSQHSPDHWENEELDKIEAEVLDRTRLVLEALSATELNSQDALDQNIEQSVAEAKHLIHLLGGKS